MWAESKRAEKMVKSGMWLYTGKSEWRTYRQFGIYGYGTTELYYELIPNW